MTIQLDPNEQALITFIEQTQKDLARVFKSNRIALDLTQTSLGCRAGIPQSRICDLETQGTNKLDIAIRVAHGLGVPLSKLLQAAEERESTIEAFSIEDVLRVRGRKRSK